MANQGFIETLLAVFGTRERLSLTKAFEEVTKFTRLGAPDSGGKSDNLAGGFFESTTSTTAGQEVAIPHTLGSAPFLLMPVLPLQSSGTHLVSLTVTRPADASYIYLSSSDTGKTHRFYVEG